MKEARLIRIRVLVHRLAGSEEELKDGASTDWADAMDCSKLSGK